MNLLIQGLARYEAVIVGDSMVVQMTEGTYVGHVNYTVDGEPRTLNTTQVIINKNSVIKKLIKGATKTVGLLLTDGTTVDHSQWLADSRKYDFEGEPDYPSLEEEYEHKKYMQRYLGSQWIQDQVPDALEDIEIKIVGEAVDTGSPYIENALAYGQGKFNNSGFYRVKVLNIISDVVQKFAQDYEFKTHSSSSGLEFIQMNGSYVFTSGFKHTSYFKNSGYNIVSSLQHAQEIVSDIKETTWQYLTLKYGTNLKVTPASASIIQGKISVIQSRVNSLEVKQKSDGTLRAVKKEINDLLEGLYAIIKGDNK